jgi:hypothetical protein
MKTITIGVFQVFIFFITSLNLDAQYVTFSATSNISKQPIKLDSVRIVNYANTFDKVIYTTSINFDSLLTSVADNYSTSTSFSISQNYPNSFNEMTNFDVNIPRNASLNLKITDYLGNTIATYSNFLAEGKHSFTLDGSGLVTGVYIITASDGFSGSAIKIIKTGNSSGTSCKFLYNNYNAFLAKKEYNSIQVIQDTFNLYGYSKGHYKATISGFIPHGNVNIVFMMDTSFSPFPFTKVQRIVHIPNCQLNRFSRSTFQGQTSESNIVDTTNLDLNYESGSFSSSNDSIIFRLGVTNNDCSYDKGLYMIIVIDSNKHLLSSIYYNYHYMDYKVDGYGYSSYTLIHFSLIDNNTPLPYSIDNVGNYISYLRNSDIGFSYCIKTGSSSQSGNNGGENKTTFLKVLDSSEEPYIEIKLLL